MLKAEITLRASSFTESHRSSNCKTGYTKGRIRHWDAQRKSGARGFSPTPLEARAPPPGTSEARLPSDPWGPRRVQALGSRMVLGSPLSEHPHSLTLSPTKASRLGIAATPPHVGCRGAGSRRRRTYEFPLLSTPSPPLLRPAPSTSLPLLSSSGVPGVPPSGAQRQLNRKSLRTGEPGSLGYPHQRPQTLLAAGRTLGPAGPLGALSTGFYGNATCS